MDIIDKLQRLAKRNRAVIGIGCTPQAKSRKLINKSTKKASASGYAEPRIFESGSDLALALDSDRDPDSCFGF